MSGIFTIDGSGNGTERFTDLAAQPVADGETITYTWSGNTKGAYVSILWTHSGGTAYGTDAIIDSTASSGSGHFTLTGTGPGDYFQVAVMDTNFDSQTNVAARNSSVSVSLTCASGPVLGVAMSHVGNAAQGGLMSYTITPSTLGEATTSAVLTASLNLPVGMSISALSGAGWTCTAAGQTGSCTRTGSFGPGTGPVINLVAAFAANATTPLVPSVTLSGGGASASASAS
ncbi:hypothetical protein, partial [Novosphingobium sp.]|uniref:hypothetical protein n=1 Tax=Novosphingobium sp. TaxID=1874826 RepID=UPI002FE329C9